MTTFDTIFIGFIASIGVGIALYAILLLIDWKRRHKK